MVLIICLKFYENVMINVEVVCITNLESSINRPTDKSTKRTTLPPLNFGCKGIKIIENVLHKIPQLRISIHCTTQPLYNIITGQSKNCVS